jgi:hypothetical protein
MVVDSWAVGLWGASQGSNSSLGQFMAVLGSFLYGEKWPGHVENCLNLCRSLGTVFFVTSTMF